MVSVFLVVASYIVLAAVFLWGLFKLIGVTFTFFDALLATTLAGAISFIPTIGLHLSIIGVLLVVYWRASEVSIPTVILCSFVAHVAAGLVVLKLLFPEAWSDYWPG